MTRVFVVAVSELARAGLTALLRDSGAFHVVGAAASIDDADADVFVVEMSDDIDVTQLDGTRVVAIGEGFDGARGTLPRSARVSQIIAAVDAVAAGLAVHDPSADRQPPQSALTGRELEVLQLLAAGHANKEIAWRLGISDHTVKFHISSIFQKLGVSSRTEAVTLGIRQGLVLL